MNDSRIKKEIDTTETQLLWLVIEKMERSIRHLKASYLSKEQWENAFKLIWNSSKQHE